MSSLKGTRTEQNLLKSFAGESQAKNRYEFFAKHAKKDGYEQIAEFFMETAAQEQQHAKTFFRFLEERLRLDREAFHCQSSKYFFPNPLHLSIQTL